MSYLSVWADIDFLNLVGLDEHESISKLFDKLKKARI